jgi:glutaredoxin
MAETYDEMRDRYLVVEHELHPERFHKVCIKSQTPKTMTPQITSADISAWMVEQLAKTHEKHEYGQISVTINQYRDYPAVPKFSIYCGKDQPTSRYCMTIEECFEDLSKQTTKSMADMKRAKAAELLAEADAIETKAATL